MVVPPEGVEPDVAEAVRRAQRGDPMALDDVVRALAPYVGRISGAIALDDGDDAVQEAMMAIVRNLGSLREPRAVWGWARRIAVREAVRVAGRRRELPMDQAVLTESVTVPDAAVAVDVRHVLASMSPEQRAVLALRHLEARARAAGPVPLSTTFDVDLRPGWCWMVARPAFYVVGFAAEAEGDWTRMAHVEALNVPGPARLRAALAPLLRMSRYAVARHVPGDLDGIDRALRA